VNRSIRARTSPSSAHPLLKTGNNRCRSHGWNAPYSKVGGLRRKASNVERWLVDRKQVAPTASKRFGLLAGGR
jgi:hypothetical protein